MTGTQRHVISDEVILNNSPTEQTLETSLTSLTHVELFLHRTLHHSRTYKFNFVLSFRSSSSFQPTRPTAGRRAPLRKRGLGTYLPREPCEN